MTKGPPMIIRPAVDADLDAILAIHNEAILHSLAIWTEEPVERSDREAWFADRAALGQPVIVADIDGAAVGYASYGPWRPKTGYRFTVEHSVYIEAGHRGQGIGHALMVELIAKARAAGLHAMMAGIEAGNSASIHLHETLGFEHVGLAREVGRKFGRWLDLVTMQLRL